MSPARLAEIPLEECWRLLEGERLGRFAVLVEDGPEIFPVNYATDRRAIVFRTAPGTKLENAPMTRVCFEVDGYDASQGSGWSVMVKGAAADITDGADRLSMALRQLAVEPLAPGQRDHWIAIYPRAITGRRFRAEPISLRPDD